MASEDLIVNDSLFTVLPQPMPGHPRGRMVSVVVKGSWAIAPGVEPAMLADTVIGGLSTIDDEPAAGALTADELSPFKPKCDVLWVGSCHAPGGKPVPALRAAIGLGAWRKEIAVIGDRSWAGTGANPVPFASMPLSWDRAFGGPGFAPNPSGRGAGVDAMPNLEDPRRLIGGKRDRPAPHCPGPVNPLWPERDNILRKTKVPADFASKTPRTFPPGFDWSYCQQAPADQQLSYLRGNEPLRLSCAHPDAADWQLRLPGVRPRIAVKDADERGQERRREMQLHCDTLIVDTDAMTLSLIWRGLLPITTPDLESLLRVALLPEFTAGPAAAENDLLDRPVEEDEPPEPPPPYEPPALMDQVPAARPPEPWTREQLEAYIAADNSPAGLDLRHSDLAGIDLSNQDLSGADLREASLANAKLDGATLNGARCQACDMRAISATGASFQGAHLVQADLSGATLNEASLAGANATEATLDGATAHHGNWQGITLYNASAKRLEADDLDLTGASANYTSFEGAKLPRAILDGFSADEAEFLHADLSEASGEGLALTNGLHSGVNLHGATIAGASLAGSTLMEANLSGADLNGADLSACILRDSNLEGADLSDADCTKAELLRARMARVLAVGTVFDEARMDHIDAPAIDCSRASFAQATLRHAQTPDAVFERAVFVATKARGWQAPDLRAAGITASEFADLSEASLPRLQAPGATFQNTALVGVELSEAVLTGATFASCLLDRARLRSVDLAKGNCAGSTITGCDFTAAKLTAAVFLQATVTKCIFTKAVLVGAEFADATFDTCLFDEARLARTSRA
jgi:uncharacterized protein YjbI with pentapeptide repeats